MAMADPEGKSEPSPDNAENPVAGPSADNSGDGSQASWALSMLLAAFCLLLVFLVWGLIVELIRWLWN
jgi:hypothetical protein